MSFDQIEFQLKYHVMERAVLAKQLQIQTLQARMESVNAIKIESEDSILQMIHEVHKTMKGISKVVLELRDPFTELKINSVYEMFKNICCIMISAVRILAQGCRNGVQRNLLLFTSNKEEKKVQKYQTLCLQQKIEELKRKEQQNKKLSKKQQYFNDVRTKMQIDRIYESVQTQKQSVQRITASNVVSKLNEVRLDWMKMINDSDKILEQAYSRKNQCERQDFAQKLHKPEYITKVLKQQLSSSIKNYFKDSVQKIIKKLYKQFFNSEYNKLKQDLLKYKPPSKDQFQQTDLEGMSSIRNILKEKKHYEKMTRQFQQMQNEKNQMVEQYIKATRNNQLYVNRIQELQRKLINIIPVRNLQKKLTQSRKSIRLSRRLSSRNSIIQIQDWENNQNQNQSKGNIAYTSSSFGLNTTQSKNKNEQNQLIIRKREKLKRIYTKSRMQTEAPQKQKQTAKLDYIQAKQITEPTNNNKQHQLKQESKIYKNLSGNNNLQGVYQQIENSQRIEQSLKTIHKQQFKIVVLQIFNLINKIKGQCKVEDKENVMKNCFSQSNAIFRKSIEVQTIPQLSINQIKQKQLCNENLVQDFQKLMQNGSIQNLFDNLIKKIMISNISIMKQLSLKQKQAQNKSQQQQINIYKQKQVSSRISGHSKLSRISNRQSIFSNKRNLASQRLSKSRNPSFSNNLLLTILSQRPTEEKQSIDGDMFKGITHRESSRRKVDKNLFAKQPQQINQMLQYQQKQYQPTERLFENQNNVQYVQQNLQKCLEFQNIVKQSFGKQKWNQSDNNTATNRNMFLTLPSNISELNHVVKIKQFIQENKRFEKIHLQTQNVKNVESKRQQQAISALKILTQQNKNTNHKPNKPINLRQNQMKDVQSQGKLFNIQKIRPSTKHQLKKSTNKQTVVKDILSICRNYRSNNSNLESLLNQYLCMAIWDNNDISCKNQNHKSLK